jgi:hypothetical protein
MTEEVTPKTFDLASALAGINYPSVEVDVYFDEALAYEIALLNEQLDLLSRSGDTEKYQSLQKTFDNFIAKVEEHKFTFTIKGVPANIENSILETIRQQFPVKKNALGMAESDNVESDVAYMEMVLQAYINKIVAPDKSIIQSPTIEDIRTLRKNAPSHVLKKIEEAIIELKNKTSNGFELGIKSADFLSKP